MTTYLVPVALALALVGIAQVVMSKGSLDWKVASEKKVAERKEKLSSAGTLGPEHHKYLSASASVIVQNIEKGEWTASEVLEAYIARAKHAQEKTNCLTEILFEQARKEASNLDKEFAASGKLKGPLHGVPVSFKDNFDIAGYDSSMGFSKMCYNPISEDCEVAATVRKAGGIPFVKTNVPQTMYNFECVNPIWGRSTNPFNSNYTPGGSSGGEGALLAMDGSALGWGTDLGGSVRLPAVWNGLCAIKPGGGRISQVGVQTMFPGLETVYPVAGSIARSVEDLELACKVVFGQEGKDFFPAPVPYRNVTLPQKLRFGYYVSDGYVKPSPVAERAVRETIEGLKRDGHECIEIEIPSPHIPLELITAIMCSDKFKDLFSFVGNDPLQTEAKSAFSIINMWAPLRHIILGMANHVLKDKFLDGIVRVQYKKDAGEVWKLVAQKTEFVRMWNKEIWERYKLDGIICPIIAIPALPHGGVAQAGAIANSLIVYNVLDVPVGAIPVTTVDPEVDALTEEWTNHKVGKGHGWEYQEKLLYSGEKAFYNADKMKGLPVGIQVVGKKWEEEKVIEMMKLVQRSLGDRGFGPGSFFKKEKV